MFSKSCILSKPQDLKVGKKLMSGSFWTFGSQLILVNSLQDLSTFSLLWWAHSARQVRVGGPKNEQFRTVWNKEKYKTYWHVCRQPKWLLKVGQVAALASIRSMTHLTVSLRAESFTVCIFVSNMVDKSCKLSNRTKIAAKSWPKSYFSSILTHLAVSIRAEIFTMCLPFYPVFVSIMVDKSCKLSKIEGLGVVHGQMDGQTDIQTYRQTHIAAWDHESRKARLKRNKADKKVWISVRLPSVISDAFTALCKADITLKSNILAK